MHDNTNKGSKEGKISGVVDKIKNIIRKNKDLGVPEDLLLRQNVSNCFVLGYLREEEIDFKNMEEVDQVVEDIKVKLSEEAIRYKPKKAPKKKVIQSSCNYDPNKIKG